MGELLKTGCTTCFDHHYVFPGGNSASLLDAQFAAAETLGVRMYASRGSMDLSKKDGGLPPDSVVQTVDEILRDCQRAVETYHDRLRAHVDNGPVPDKKIGVFQQGVLPVTGDNGWMSVSTNCRNS